MALCRLRVINFRTRYCRGESELENPINFSRSAIRFNSSSSSSSQGVIASTMDYEKELAAAKKEATLVARLCQYPFFLLFISFMVLNAAFDGFVQKVQKALLQSGVHSISDKSPVTVADYGKLNYLYHNAIIFV
ncbi:hypothetical protein K1719_015593 [Acacia pycnantha]|nr:hypothetical protein K1719_015593 [Acacia pycnantha]